MPLILLIGAFILALIACIWFSADPPPNWRRVIAASLACYFLSLILASGPVVHHLAP